MEIGECRAGVLPVDKVHNVAETAEHTIAARRDFFRLLIHQVIRVAACACGFSHFILTEPIAEPAHNHAGLERQRFILPQPGDCVAVYAHTALRVCCAVCGIKFILPEAAAEYGCLPFAARADADCAKLAVTAADNNGRAFRKPCIRCAFRADNGKIRAAFYNGRENIGAQAAFFGNLREPVAALQIHDACCAGVAWLYGKFPG